MAEEPKAFHYRTKFKRDVHALPPPDHWRSRLVTLKMYGHEAYFSRERDARGTIIEWAFCDVCGGAWTLADDLNDPCYGV